MVKRHSQHNHFMFVELKDVDAGNGWKMLFRWLSSNITEQHSKNKWKWETEQKNAKPQNLRNQLFSNTQTTASLDHLSAGVPHLAELHGMICLKWWKVEKGCKTQDILSKTKVHPIPISTTLN